MKQHCILFLALIYLQCIGWVAGQSPALGNHTCPEDYTPCTCHQLKFMDYMEVSCDGVSFHSIQSVLRRSTRDVTMLRLTLSASNNFIPADIFGGKKILYTVLTCSSSSTPLKIHPDAFRSSQDFTRAFEVKGCDMTQLDYTFLTEFTVLRSLKFDNFSNTANTFHSIPKVLPSLTDLSVVDSPDFHNFTFLDLPFLANLTSVEVHNCPNFTSFQGLPASMPNLRSLVITSCPNFKHWDVFRNQLTGLTDLSLSGSKLGDEAVSEMLEAVVSSPLADTLTYLNLRDNRMTKIPEQISRLTSLKDLNLAHNSISLLDNGSLNLVASKVGTVYLFSNELRAIEPVALKGDMGGARIDLQNNNLTRFEAAVFLPLLENMEKSEAALGSGRIFLYQNPIECDCHLSWLVRDRPNLLRHITLGYCANGTAFNLLNPDGFSNCSTDFPVIQSIAEELPNSRTDDIVELIELASNSSTEAPFILAESTTELIEPTESDQLVTTTESEDEAAITATTTELTEDEMIQSSTTTVEPEPLPSSTSPKVTLSRIDSVLLAMSTEAPMKAPSIQRNPPNSGSPTLHSLSFITSVSLLFIITLLF